MAGLQESLKASSGINVKELIENFSGKGNIKQSINELTKELSDSNERHSLNKKTAGVNRLLFQFVRLASRKPRRSHE